MADGGAPRFSVLLPTYNRADVLGLAIASVLAQTEGDFELLVVADGCTDGTSDVVAAVHDARIRFIDCPKAPGFGYANRNVALRQARGRLVAFAAHDDLWLPDHLQKMGDMLDESGADWGYSRPVWVSTDGIVVPFATNLRLPDEMEDFARINTIPAGCVVHTFEALERAGFWPEDGAPAGDWLLWRRMIASSSRAIAYLRHPTNLHFSANWKNSRFSSTREVEVLLGIADDASWWPSILRYPSTPGGEQAAIWPSLRDGGAKWVAAFRAAIESVIDRVFWQSIRQTHPELTAARASLGEAVAARAAAATDVDTILAASSRELQTLRTEAAAEISSARAEAAVEIERMRAEAAVSAAEVHRIQVASLTNIQAVRDESATEVRVVRAAAAADRQHCQDAISRLWSHEVPGRLAGFIESITQAGCVCGWALDEAHPRLPVLLEVVAPDGKVVGTTIAGRFRLDLLEAGLGDGYCQFICAVDVPDDELGALRVRRLQDHAELAHLRQLDRTD